MEGLRDLRVVDFSTAIAGPYCTKLFVDAGADVVKVEPPEGDPLRSWSATGADPTAHAGGPDAALFRYLNAGKRSVLGRPEDPDVLDLVEGADLVVDSFAAGSLDALDLCDRYPGLVWLSLTPRGQQGPWVDRPATEFVIQAECGSIGSRGRPGHEPFQAGGRTTEFFGGVAGAVAALAAVRGARETGHGERIDLSLLEGMTMAASNYLDLIFRLLGVEELGGSGATVETPSIEPTADGYVGFCTNTRQQISDFMLLIERPDLRDDEGLAQIAGRIGRFDEWNEIVHAYTKDHGTAEIVQAASMLRIPVAPVNDAQAVLSHEQFVERGVFCDDPTATFKQPRRPYRIDDVDPPRPRPAPGLGQHSGEIEARIADRPLASGDRKLPLEGVRILDMTNWLAGPSSTHILAALGADVIHLESTGKPDGVRMVGGMLAGKVEKWWEASHFFLAFNTNKRGITLDLSKPRGLELVKQLITRCDAVFENFTPRVMDGFGLTWETIHKLNPRTSLVRMPAFGLSGPWRDLPGFAQTMEQMAGLAWVTGHPDDQPRIQRGPCDPLAGLHAAYAFLVVLTERDATGEGRLVESTMVEAALNVAAEQLVEFTAYGNLMQREGNRCAEAAPQGLYACAGSAPGAEHWLAVSVANDEQWRALDKSLGSLPGLSSPDFDTGDGRRAGHDRIDGELRRVFADRDRDEVLETLLGAGVPAAVVADPRAISQNPQMVARGFFETLAHPVAGELPIPTLPFRFESVGRWLREPAPLLGQHNREVLGELLGIDDEEFARLEAERVIGDRPEGL
ncbi:MAG: CoA transferase [Myxococcales bacterium]|nr:CoA transferase [Myxococcales bacterium]